LIRLWLPGVEKWHAPAVEVASVAGYNGQSMDSPPRRPLQPRRRCLAGRGARRYGRAETGMSVYSVRMARVNVYLPDELAERARAAGVNISGVTQDAIRSALAGMDTDRWLDRLNELPQASVPHERVIRALDAARDELGA